MKLKDFIVENKQVIIEGVNYNYEVINMEEVFSELLAESAANIKCVGNIDLVANLITQLGDNKYKTLALAHVDNFNYYIAFDNEDGLNDAVAESLITSSNPSLSQNIDTLIKKFSEEKEIKTTLETLKKKANDTGKAAIEFKKTLVTLIANNCKFTKEVIDVTKSTFIMIWKDQNAHIPKVT